VTTINLNDLLDLATLESVLVNFFSPSFLHITKPDEDNDIQLIISSSQFNHLTTQERIKSIMECIMLNLPNMFENRLIIIQAYATDEFEDVIDYLLEDELEGNSIK